MFDEVLAEPMRQKDGYISPRMEPGFGIVLRQDKLDQYRIA
jgi:L-alanine-DL-glutamate epimerase-like enolase superfamily enzyme